MDYTGEVMKLEPNNPKARYRKAQCQFNMKNYDEAIAIISEFPKSRGQFAFFWFYFLKVMYIPLFLVLWRSGLPNPFSCSIFWWKSFAPAPLPFPVLFSCADKLSSIFPSGECSLCILLVKLRIYVPTFKVGEFGIFATFLQLRIFETLE